MTNFIEMMTAAINTASPTTKVVGIEYINSIPTIVFEADDDETVALMGGAFAATQYYNNVLWGIIVYNKCEKQHDYFEFMLNHERGHVAHNHTISGAFSARKINGALVDASLEKEADNYALLHSSTESIKAFKNFLSEKNKEYELFGCLPIAREILRERICALA